MSDRDTITLPREVVQEALEALEFAERHNGGDDCYADSITALRAALAAPRLEVTVDPRLTAEEAAAISAALAAEQPKPEPVAKACWACNGKGCLRDIDTAGLLPCVVCKPQEDKT